MAAFFPIVVAQLSGPFWLLLLLLFCLLLPGIYWAISVPPFVVVVAAVIGPVLFSILLTNLLAGNTVASKCNYNWTYAQTKDSGNELLHTEHTHTADSSNHFSTHTHSHTHNESDMKMKVSISAKLTSFRFVSPVSCRLSCCCCYCCCLLWLLFHFHFQCACLAHSFTWFRFRFRLARSPESCTTGLDPHAQRRVGASRKNHTIQTHTNTQSTNSHTHTHTCTLARCAHSAHTCHTARNLALKRRSMEGGFLYIPYKKTQRQVRERGRVGGLVG